MQAFDCAIVGAGPAGMSAAIVLARAGVQVAVLDRAPRAGGQVFRSAANSPVPDVAALGSDYSSGAALISRFEESGAAHFAGADAWHLGDDGRILFSHEGDTRELRCREMLLCPGAMERPMPIPGWTKPGVMTAGAAQVMLKSDAVVAEGAVFAGSGPLLYLIVAQYLRLGVPVAALVDTTPRRHYFDAAPQMFRALGHIRQLSKGLSLLREIRASGVAVHQFAERLEVIGGNKAEGVRFVATGKHHEIAADTVFLHHGVQPNLNMTRAMDLDHHWNPEQMCWQVSVDDFGQSSIAHVSVAGDSAGIVGADGAQAAGRLVALNILNRLGHLSQVERDQKADKDLSYLSSLKPFRRFIDCLYHPTDALRLPRDPETLVCRCEEQSLDDLRKGFEQGARDPNALKSLTRCGMGPCQGRQCGHVVAGLLAKWRGENPETVGYYRLRSPQRLLTLDELSRYGAVQAEAAE
ncbi:NAD(P)/FAD-dependent oxidoreductase [Ruegeria lacuscaerulensis]|uniref:NAD(P)/FAD-dependent oxidoreductase n=1 Tax=Ruegeria lacuscaerulensis TaxID=55218 RepID=UPI0014807207|nr:FAD/NAD(P)-binding oxidoreductase [Ruegeria lacuscaerulensis]